MVVALMPLLDLAFPFDTGILSLSQAQASMQSLRVKRDLK